MKDLRKSLTLLYLLTIVLGIGTRVVSGKDTLIRAKTIYTVTKGVLEDGEILIRDGKIQAVGKTVAAPTDAEVHEAYAVIPGLIDAHTHLALDRSGRASGPVTSEWKAVEHLDLDDPMLQVALSGGVTSIITRPGSGIICSGQSVALKLKRNPEVLKPYVDLKLAVRPLVKLRPGETPATVMGWYATASEMFRRAQEYMAANETGDERLEAFAAALRGDVMVYVHTNYPGEIMMVMNLAREYGFLDRLPSPMPAKPMPSPMCSLKRPLSRLSGRP